MEFTIESNNPDAFRVLMESLEQHGAEPIVQSERSKYALDVAVSFTINLEIKPIDIVVLYWLLHQFLASHPRNCIALAGSRVIATVRSNLPKLLGLESPPSPVAEALASTCQQPAEPPVPTATNTDEDSSCNHSKPGEQSDAREAAACSVLETWSRSPPA